MSCGKIFHSWRITIRNDKKLLVMRWRLNLVYKAGSININNMRKETRVTYDTNILTNWQNQEARLVSFPSLSRSWQKIWRNDFRILFFNSELRLPMMFIKICFSVCHKYCYDVLSLLLVLRTCCTNFYLNILTILIVLIML